MGYRLRIIAVLLCAWTFITAQAGGWTTHFAYNNVTQIAMASDKVFAISDGSLFSVDKQTEQVRIYNRQSGLHATGITCIHYDEKGQQLIIAYDFGKMDILSSSGVQYIGALYDKDMTQRKTIYNITISGRTAYLSTHYGVQTMDLRENKLVDSYWLRPNGAETPIKDVLLRGDSIYAFGEDSLYCAKLSDPLSDYTYWHREKLGRIERDNDKGKHYQDATDHWYAGYTEGIVRFTPTERLTYKPNGPLQNNPYRLTAQNGMLYMVPGGRWASEYQTPAVVMCYDGQQWTNITTDAIKAQTQNEPKDFLNVAVDAKDRNHYFVTSYGTGLYEFRGNQLVSHEIAGGDNSLTAVVPSSPARYTRLDGATFDTNGSLWMLDANTMGQLQCKAHDGSWHGMDIKADNENIALHTPAGLVLDNHRANHKWIAAARYNTFVCLIDDHGSAFDTSDDRVQLRTEWTDQHGETFKPENIHDIRQDAQGRLWLATEQGVVYIDADTDFFASDAIVRPEITDENGENPVVSQRIHALCEDAEGQMWLGTQLHGVYVLNSEATQIIAHYTTDNTAMPSDGILSIACDIQNGHVFVGTGEGLVEYDPKGWEEGIENDELMNGDASLNEGGSMQQWKLHFSYSNPEEIAASSKQIYAAANGSLFSVDRADEALVYWNKATGLHGTSVSHIAYDAASNKLIIAYENGQIDLLDDEGNVTQMPDLSMKAGSIEVTVNSICVGSNHVYLAMPFGIITIQPRKSEVSDTYYIGANGMSVHVQHVAEWNDSIYAFSFDRMYKAALKDNLVDYSFWQSEVLPFEQASQVAIFKDHLYVLAHDSLYRREGTNWQLVRPEKIAWIHVHDGQLVAYQSGTGLFKLTDEDQWIGLTNGYVATDAVYSNGEYWLAEEGKGLVRLGTEGDQFFRPEGPMSNFGYRLFAAHDQIYVAPGGRWATQFGRQSGMSIYDGQSWRGIPWQDTWYYTDHDIRDVVSYAIDPNDAGHFFVATYGTGVFEFKDYKAIAHYDSVNSTLRVAQKGLSDYYFTRTDGAMMDEQGNLWVLNATGTGKPIHVRNTFGQWKGLDLPLTFTTPTGIWVDSRNANRKWLFDQRGDNKGVILLDDGGTPTSTYDDRYVKRSSWIDQNGNTITPSSFYSFAQDHTNRIWIGTDTGIVLIPSGVDFFSSNSCHRIIIPRNDGTNLGDYLLGDEQINSLAVDGGNRMWIGTASSGLYLIEDDTITVAHFTENNSLLPSNTIQSIAILPKTGEVFVGTDKGIASYRSDASEAQEDMSGAYAYPNPVRPGYSGVISITGLMDNTVVNIVDAGGNLVCKTKSHGGTAVWDGKLPDGRRATPGVYTAMCNAANGHTVVKILVAY